MSEKLLFDTLNYAKMLEKGGVTNSDTHTSALSYALAQNLYTKVEIDQMIENTMNQFKQEMHEFRQEMRTDMNDFRLEVKNEINELRLEMKGLEISLDKKMSLKLGIMTTIITFAIALSHFLQ